MVFLEVVCLKNINNNITGIRKRREVARPKIKKLIDVSQNGGKPGCLLIASQLLPERRFRTFIPAIRFNIYL